LQKLAEFDLKTSNRVKMHADMRRPGDAQSYYDARRFRVSLKVSIRAAGVFKVRGISGQRRGTKMLLDSRKEHAHKIVRSLSP